MNQNHPPVFPPMPSLGFPEEEWGADGALFCRPRADIVAAFFRARAKYDSTFHVSLAKYAPGSSSLEDVWMQFADHVAVFEVDCPLQAQAVIQNFIDTHPNLGE